ncbi:uncharacterized protein J7T54_004535 [Emericellopsis cladophorae]|uniref:Cytochrome P450 n=1 Tax=Emericellopsis cladophorae TaxID=2686198 RepID=A0A9P9Y6T6_9HYPO|nr:uncharacterized protein J7T54_004535 [Emericellopsis cladophorae]KAI6783989.1 hypothetical protein J7T54_004535 [Emericellopsis cladophorae]
MDQGAQAEPSGLTNWYRFYLVRTGDYQHQLKALHDKHGPVIRLGPNVVDLDYPELIKTMYGTDNKYLKTDFYHNNSTKIVLTVEPLVDKVIDQLLEHLEERFVKTAKTCDLGEWIAFCTWDMVGAASFSEDFGYMAQGKDHDGTISTEDKAFDYFAAIGQVPILDYCLDKNPIKRIGPPNLGNATRVAIEHIAARTQGNDRNFDPKTPGYLQRFMEVKETYPDIVDDGMVMNYVFINLLAGSDTTALTIRAVMYYVLKHPDVYRKLKSELGKLELGRIAQYSEAKALPYLDACVREAIRVHPGVSMMLERYAPAEGLTLPDGRYIPPFTKVGMNPFIINRNPCIWGNDPDTFRPERWLQQDDESGSAFAERTKLFNAADFSFGAGSRMCLGRHLALLQTYKIVAALVGRYDIRLTNPERE